MKIDVQSRFPSGWRKVCDLLEGAGHKVFFVGGCVRDAILGRAVSDVDLATSADAKSVLEIATVGGLKSVPVGLAYGSVLVCADESRFAVTSFRKDLKSDGRHPSIAYSDDIVEDAMRRDFTMNALYAFPDGEVVDPLGGLDDLLAGRVRFIGDPRDRIREDYLRILRFFRMHVRYAGDGQELDPDGLEAVSELAEGLARISRERIGEETVRMLESPKPSRGLLPMERIGILGRILPGSSAAPLPVLEELERKHEIPPAPLRRLALLGGREAARSLRLSRDSMGIVGALFRAKSAKETPSAAGYRLGNEMAIDALLLRAAETGESLEDNFKATVAHAATRTFPLSGSDLMPRYIGAALGGKLEELKRIWIDSGFSLDRNYLLSMADAADRSASAARYPTGRQANRQ